MKKIGILLGNVQGNGGISRVTWILSNRLCNKYDVYILSDFHTGSERYTYNKKIKISYLVENRISIHKRLPSCIKGIRRFIKDNDLDVFICAGAIYFPPCSIAIKGLRTKLICWEHSNVSVKGEHKFQKLCRWFGAKNADWIVPLTKTDEKLYNDIYGNKNVTAIYNPVDERLMNEINYSINSHKIVSVGRFCWQKNFELLVDVARIVLDNNPDWSWDIYGEGETFEVVESLINEYHLEGRLNLKGRVDDLYNRYKDYSFLVMTSRFEGFPMTLLESTAQGIPAVAFDVLTGPNEVIVDGESGFLIEPFNVRAMSDKIQALIDSDVLRNKMSDKCFDIRNNFELGSIVNKWIMLIDSVTDDR